MARALALIEGHEVDEVDGPANSLGHDDDGLDLTDRCWWSEVDGCWLTDFPPPSDFTGYESRPYDDIDDEEPYVRACTHEEADILKRDDARARAAERAENEQLRDEWFALLRAECSEADATSDQCSTTHQAS